MKTKEQLIELIDKKIPELERAERLKLEFQENGSMELSRAASHRADELSNEIQALQAQLSEVTK